MFIVDLFRTGPSGLCPPKLLAWDSNGAAHATIALGASGPLRRALQPMHSANQKPALGRLIGKRDSLLIGRTGDFLAAQSA